ncbi:MAG: SGNH/GDSL hydrolase family protein [Clostridia bacterium]|nr:SGNH/GDSL hydrolase family protein [Clostridia bacterium]
MKTVFLLGDSIRLGYERYVKAMLEDYVKVYTPGEVNGGMAQYLQRWVHVWARERNVPTDLDLVHWNAGLWDVLRIWGDDTFTSPDFYAETLVKIHNRLRHTFPKAKLVFALSTAVREEGYIGNEYKRYNSDIRLFNEIAIKTLQPLGEEFDDLYSVSETAPKACYSDPTHFNTLAGIERIGGTVVACICEKLDIDKATLVKKQAELFEIPEKILGN